MRNYGNSNLSYQEAAVSLPAYGFLTSEIVSVPRSL